jgi:hypothetical protein
MMMLILLIDKQVSDLDVFDISFSFRGGFRAWSLDNILIEFFFSSVVWEGASGPMLSHD